MNSNNPKFGLALSGGGFRATLFHLGVLRYLKDKEQLQNLTHITAVSGGSIMAAHLWYRWETYSNDFDAAAKDLLEFIQWDLRGRVFRRILWGIFDRWNRTSLLEQYYEEKLFSESQGGSEETATKRPKICILTTDINSGDLYGFEPDHLTVSNDDKVIEDYPTDLPKLATKVAMSSAFPVFFPPMKKTPKDLGLDATDAKAKILRFTDGGAYDNLGIRRYLVANDLVANADESHGGRGAFNADLPSLVLVSDAGKKFEYVRQTERGWLANNLSRAIDVFSTSSRAVDILTKRLQTMERASALKNSRDFKYISLQEELTEGDCLTTSLQKRLAEVRTDFDKFSEFEILCLTRQGFCAARNTWVKIQKKRESESTGESCESTASPAAGGQDEPKVWEPPIKFTHDDEPVLKLPNMQSKQTEIQKRRKVPERSSKVFKWRDLLSRLWPKKTKAEKQQRRLKRSSKAFKWRNLLWPFSGNDLWGSFSLLCGLILIVSFPTIIYSTFFASYDWHDDPYIAKFKDTNKIRVAFTTSYTTEGRSNEDFMRMDTFDERLASNIVEQLKVILELPSLKMVPEPWDQTDTARIFPDSKADLIVSGFSFVPERERRFGLRFSAPYLTTRFAFLTASNQSVNLEKSRLAAFKNTTSETLANLFVGADRVGADRVELLTDAADMLDRIKESGDLKVVMDEQTAKFMVSRHKGLKYEIVCEANILSLLPSYLRPQRYVVAVPADAPRLLREVNFALMRIDIDKLLNGPADDSVE